MAVKGGGWGIGILGVVSMIFGILVIMNPMVGGAALVLFLGAISLISGIGVILLSFRLRSKQDELATSY